MTHVVTVVMLYKGLRTEYNNKDCQNFGVKIP